MNPQFSMIDGYNWTTTKLVDWSASVQWRAPIAKWIRDWQEEHATYPVHTSGSTGAPQDLQIAREYFVASAQMTAAALDVPAGSRAALVLPVQYIAGQMMVVRALVNDWELLTIGAEW